LARPRPAGRSGYDLIVASPEPSTVDSAWAAADVVMGQGVALVNASGEFDLASVDVLVSALAEACGTGCDVQLDMSGVSFIDASTLGVVVRARETSAALGRKIEIVRPARIVRRLLGLTGLESLTAMNMVDGGSR
jgi:anti-sigma B factor antagonist